MSEHAVFMEEKREIDNLIEKGNVITNVRETLDGSIIKFENPKKKEVETLLITNANARKYFSNLIIKHAKTFETKS